MDYCEQCSRNSTKMDHPQQSTYLNHQQHIKTHRRSHKRWLHSHLVTSPLLLVLLATLIPLSLASSTCKRHEYLDMKMGDCVQCTKCTKHEIIERPCQPHMNTVCKPLNTIEIDWAKSMATERATRHHPSSSIETYSAQTSVLQEDEVIWDWEMVSLVLAVIACLMFFIGTAIISINYIRQWRKIKKQFDTDIEGLSQQLMARLAMPTHDGSAIFIDDPSSKRSALGPRQIEVRCVFLEDILDGKESLKEPQGTKLKMSKGPTGNVYINDHEKQQHNIILGHKFV